MKTISDLIWDMENDEKKIENTGGINTCQIWIYIAGYRISW